MTAYRLFSGMAAMLVLGGGFALASPASATTCDYSTPPGGMSFCVYYDGSVTSLSNASQFETAFQNVVEAFSSAITNNTSSNPIDIYVSSGALIGSSAPVGAPTPRPYQALAAGDASSSFTTLLTTGSSTTSFANIETALGGTGAVLPQTDPTGGNHTWYLAQAEVKALALSSTYPISANYDGYIGFANSTNEFFYGSTPVAGEISFQAAAEHELEEVLGRTSSLNSGGLTSGFSADPLDLFRCGSNGKPNFSEWAPAYASVDGCKTGLGSFDNTSSGGDRSDWLTPVPTTSTDAQNSFFTTDTNEGLSTSDEQLLQALGYDIAANNRNGLFSAANDPAGATVPEPASLSLLAAGAGMAGVVRRKVRRRAIA